MPAVSGLNIYPIKSCAGIALNEARLLETGLEYDRNWMVVDRDGLMLTQRSHGRLALIRVALDEGNGDLIVAAPGMPELRTPLAVTALGRPALIETRVWRDAMSAFDTGPQTEAWFSTFLGVPARLVRFDPAVRRVVDPLWTGDIEAITQFADGFPLLVIGEASLADLNRRLTGKGAPSIPMNRFRPNLVFTGIDAYHEDYVESLTVWTADGTAQLHLVKPCARCPMPSIDQDSGAPDPQWPNEPLDTMSAYRGNARLDGALTFGQNAIVSSGFGARLALGQQIDAELRFED
ncbi:MOSC domain-containing protein [Paraburkholderia sp. BCC1885]|uniref:MOSC domain-containing protein n=1 Tax=Paraburkholderia sp. BCC1885 TaxID=2562669 RepID=UPI001182A58D|nr:MOSC N-terminal beta barrel domain-containing protein [Paraburkholderia sp. BCC1885]